ncbi:MAG: sporulation protein YabP [Bacilli bacterium]|nr:sporulation protein YabP [Bacilli bacterium]
MSDGITFGSQEVKIIDRSSISLTGINKIVSFDDEEFLMESNMGNIRLLGEALELLKLDTNEGNVKIKGKINSFTYLDGKLKNKEESMISKLFK